MIANAGALSGSLPQGERVLWQGRPCWRALAKRAFQVSKLAVYFAILLIWYGVSSFTSGEAAGDAGVATLRMTGIALVPLALVCAYAWLTSRTTTYTITDRRVVFGIGIALPMTINLPFSKIETACVDVTPDGTGSIVLSLPPTERLAYFLLWPHARPWRMARAEPMLRCSPDAARVSQILARSLAASAGLPVQAAPIAATSTSKQPEISTPEISALA
jgi:hypothetical protein